MHIAMATFFGFLYMGWTLAPHGEYMRGGDVALCEIILNTFYNAHPSGVP